MRYVRPFAQRLSDINPACLRDAIPALGVGAPGPLRPAGHGDGRSRSGTDHAARSPNAANDSALSPPRPEGA